ncbi:hypothetical protein DES40_2139 [Litorimonas taeanensis]|uniref:Nudix hydrolase 3 n=1 Tax=Litorimonas taeanensis TaxID=568099 RepID=A0A420WE92_9PROT|nr:NUDIX hydrolase [Litorimonas taeanensis]RKQ69339.1 hypothetical protein DES40_2139 [Litorimonas taeanensis]
MKRLIGISAAALLMACQPASSEKQAAAPIDMAQTIDYFEGAWTPQQTGPLLDKTMRLRFPYDASLLSAGEQEAVKELLAAGARLHSLYLDQVHPQSRAVEAAMAGTDRQDLKDLFRMMKGPIATTLENTREPFLNVAASTTPRNVYPSDSSREALDAFIAAHPEKKSDLLHLRSVVKNANDANKAEALATLDAHPALEVLHPGLIETIKQAEGYFALPYSVAYAEDILFVYDRLMAAASAIENDDVSFARFLRLRARDLLADDYDGGDATWVTGNFTGNLNAQIGSYETYDDALYGVKSFFSLSLLQRDKEKSEELASSIGDIQEIEDSLPYAANKTVRSNIPVSVYNIIADFGQARGTNTATILPNEGHLSRQFGRTILIRSTVLRNEEIFEESLSAFRAATSANHHDDLGINGNFYRTLWHEIGHYMGPDQTKIGEDIDAALQDNADLIEEMKADLVSLFSALKLYKAGNYTEAQLRSIYAGGILRVLNKNRPRREQAYGTMQLVQWNWFLDKGVLTFDEGKLSIHYDKYPAAVESLLTEVLNLQYQGNREAAAAFVDEWTAWDKDLHGVIGAAMKASETSRFRLVTYEALGE